MLIGSPGIIQDACPFACPSILACFSLDVKFKIPYTYIAGVGRIYGNMNIQHSSRIRLSKGPIQVLAQHPYLLLYLAFFLVAGVAAGISTAKMTQDTGPVLLGAFSQLQSGTYQLWPGLLRSAALNLLLFEMAYIPKLWPPLIVVSGVPVGLKGFFMGAGIFYLEQELGMKGLGWSIPLCVAPGFFLVAGVILRILSDASERVGQPVDGLTQRAAGFVLVCVLLESGAAPAALRAWLK